MKIILPLIIAIGLLSVNCKTVVSNNNNEIKPGGWQDQQVDNEIVKKAYTFLEKEVKENFQDITLQKVISAQTQVVAGYNVMLKCEYKNKTTVADNLKAIIHIDLQDKYKLIHIGFDLPKLNNAPKKP